MEEIIDIMNEEDKVISTSTKNQAHEMGFIHRVVHGILINSKGQIFLVKRSPTRVHGPNLFDASIGGHVKSGENYEKAIIREGKEELGISGVYKFIFKYLSDHPQVKHFVAVFIINQDGPVRLDKREFCEGIWKSPEDIFKISKDKFTPDYYNTLHRLKEAGLLD